MPLIQVVPPVEPENASRGGPHGAPRQPVIIRSRSYTAILLEFQDCDRDRFVAELDRHLRQAPGFFRGAPTVLDLAEMAAARRQFDLAGLVAELRHRGILPVGIQNGSDWLNHQAQSLGLPVLRGGRDAPLSLPDAPDAGHESRPDDAEPPEPAMHAGRAIDPPADGSAAPAATEADGGAGLNSADAGEPPLPIAATPPQTRVVTEPVRSGQQVFADSGDLIVMAPVSAGAEVIARGNVHIYGPLRGRALAGVNGDESARIFCQRLEAELIAVAGLYKVSEDIDRAHWRRRVHIGLEADRLVIAPLA